MWYSYWEWVPRGTLWVIVFDIGLVLVSRIITYGIILVLYPYDCYKYCTDLTGFLVFGVDGLLSCISYMFFWYDYYLFFYWLIHCLFDWLNFYVVWSPLSSWAKIRKEIDGTLDKSYPQVKIKYMLHFQKNHLKLYSQSFPNFKINVVEIEE